MKSEMLVVEPVLKKCAFCFLLEFCDVLELAGKLSMNSFVWLDAGNYLTISYRNFCCHSGLYALMGKLDIAGTM